MGTVTGLRAHFVGVAGLGKKRDMNKKRRETGQIYLTMTYKP
jgi:hypothetical protein